MRRRRQHRQHVAAIEEICRVHGYEFSGVETALILDRSMKLERLVLWLALPFRVVTYPGVAGQERVTWNTPTFPHAYPWGEDMPEAREMERLFHQIVGPPTEVKS